jgi:hypothetical protein
MSLEPSPLSQVCKGIRAYLDGEINGPDRDKVNVILATPAETAADAAGETNHRLNLFFYRFEPAGLFPDNLPGQTGWLRAFCLVTPFGIAEDGIGAGENDLRLLGEVVRIFQEKPVFRLTLDGADYQLQVIFQSFGLDQLNQLWSTQGDTTYRPSVMYEVSLAPVVPLEPAIPAPLAGGFGVRTYAELDPAAEAVSSRVPEVPPLVPDLGRVDWTPAVAWVTGTSCAFSLSFAVGSAALAAFVPRVWLAGKVGETVRLRWQTWDATQGWQAGSVVNAVVPSTSIDPETVAGAPVVDLTLPFNNRVGQMLLHAERDYARPADGVIVTVQSNPLLISLYGP